VTDAGLAPSVGAVGAPFDNAMVEAFWARMQVELLNRQHWKTRVELASAIHDYIEIWHNTRRRHSALNMLTPTEYEMTHYKTHASPVDIPGRGQQADHSPWNNPAGCPHDHRPNTNQQRPLTIPNHHLHETQGTPPCPPNRGTPLRPTQCNVDHVRALPLACRRPHEARDPLRSPPGMIHIA
jgi:putative transposase